MPIKLLRQRLKQVPRPASLSINRTHPLADGLIGAYLPGISWVDYTGINKPFLYVDVQNAGAACTGIPAVTQEGPVIGTAVNTGYGLCTAAGALSPRIVAWTPQISFYIRYRQIGVSTASANGMMFVRDAANTASPIGFGPLTSSANSNLHCLYYGAFSTVGPGAAVSNGIHGVLASLKINPLTSNVWVDAASYLTSTGVSAGAGTQSTAALEIQAMPDTAMMAIYFWDHALTQQDAVLLESDPYGIFASPAFDLQTFLPPAAVDPFVNAWL